MKGEMVLSGLFIVLYLIASTSPPIATESEMEIEGRGVWVDMGSLGFGPEDIKKIIDKLADNNFNMLFVHTIHNGQTIYPSRITAQAYQFIGWDPLEVIIEEAHKRGMEVHSWCEVFYQGGGISSALRENPEWALKNRYGFNITPSGMHWLSPAIPEVRNYLVSLFEELVRSYDIDGLHLDYVRYPFEVPLPFGYEEASRGRYKSLTGLDPIDFYPQRTPEDWAHWWEWSLWREDQVTALVKQISLETKRIKPDLLLSAAVFPDYHYNKYTQFTLQEWKEWVDKGYLDFICPMAYRRNIIKVGEAIKEDLEIAKGKVLVYAGLGVHLIPYPSELNDQIDLVRESGAAGVVLFAYPYLSSEYMRNIREGVFSKQALIPHQNPEESISILLDQLREILIGYEDLLSLPEIDPVDKDDLISLVEEIDNLLEKIDENSLMNKQGEDIASLTRRIRDIAGYASRGIVSPRAVKIFVFPEIEPRPSAIVRRASIPPVIDGVLEEIWNSSEVLTDFTLNTGQGASLYPTYAYILYDDDNLYVGFRCPEKGVKDLKVWESRRDGNIFQDDTVEVFIDTNGDEDSYYHLAVNTIGVQFDQQVAISSAYMNSGWSAFWRSAVKVEGDLYAVEIAIPFEHLGISKPKSGESWGLNLGRSEVRNSQFSSWSGVYGSFHTPWRFGGITFE